MKTRDWKNKGWLTNEVRSTLDRSSGRFSSTELESLTDAIDHLWAPDHALFLLIEVVCQYDKEIAKRCDPVQASQIFDAIGAPDTVLDLGQDLEKFKLATVVTKDMPVGGYRVEPTELGQRFVEHVLMEVYFD